MSGDINKTIATVKRMHFSTVRYIYATAIGYYIREEKPPKPQGYVAVFPDGTVKTIQMEDRLQGKEE